MAKFSYVGIDVKVPLWKTTGHTTSPFQNHRLENKLLQELGDTIFIIISNTMQWKVSPFIKFIWEDQIQLEFINTIVWNLLLFIIYLI